MRLSLIFCAFGVHKYRKVRFIPGKSEFNMLEFCERCNCSAAFPSGLCGKLEKFEGKAAIAILATGAAHEIAEIVQTGPSNYSHYKEVIKDYFIGEGF